MNYEGALTPEQQIEPKIRARMDALAAEFNQAILKWKGNRNKALEQAIGKIFFPLLPFGQYYKEPMIKLYKKVAGKLLNERKQR